MYGDGEACLAGKLWEGVLSLLSDGAVAITVPSLPAAMSFMVPFSEEEVFLK